MRNIEERMKNREEEFKNGNERYNEVRRKKSMF